MARTYTDAEKQAAVALYETDGPTAVEKQLGIPKGTLSQWVRKAGAHTVRSEKTAAATEAKAANDKHVRALVASQAISVTKRISEIIAKRLDEDPDSISTRDLGTIFGIFADKHLALQRVDGSTQDLPAVDAWLAHMMGKK